MTTIINIMRNINILPVKDPIRRKAIQKRYRENHKEQIKTKAKEYRLQHKEQIKQISREYYHNNQERERIRLTIWRSNNPDKYKEQIQRRIYFKGKYITLDKNPRTGMCTNCGKVEHTNLHHINYHERDPLMDTVELCVSCHRRTHIQNER